MRLRKSAGVTTEKMRDVTTCDAYTKVEVFGLFADVGDEVRAVLEAGVCRDPVFVASGRI